MERKFSTPVELHEFFLGELKNIVGKNYRVIAKEDLFDFDIKPRLKRTCLHQLTFRDLIKFFEKYGFNFYVDFEFGKLRAFTTELTQKRRKRL